ncbi:MAG: PEP-CTERM sorting domain-containing protein [Bacteroidales bacterium]|nr:PEP-CTERM sorting domain-containing protein [Candidatus Colimorpha merdihippi]
MKLHLPIRLSRLIRSVFIGTAAFYTIPDAHAQDYPKGEVVYTTQQQGYVELTRYSKVLFENIDGTQSDNSWGGAVSDCYGFSVENCEHVIFQNNNASFEGGALQMGTHWSEKQLPEKPFNIQGNSSVVFYQNTSDALGGAICRSYYNSPIVIQENSSVRFIENAALGGSAFSNFDGRGGITIENNGEVEFSKNHVVRESTFEKMPVVTSAIAVGYSGAVQITGNDNVVFRGNDVAISCLHWGIGYLGWKPDPYKENYINQERIILSAGKGQSITFYEILCNDGILSVNNDYTDKDGNIAKGEGDVVFSGKYLDEDITKWETAALYFHADFLGVEKHTIRVDGKTKLYAGTLHIEDGMILQTHGVDMAENTGAMLVVKDAALRSLESDINISAGSTLQIEGESEVSAPKLIMADGSKMQLADASLNLAADATLHSVEVDGVNTFTVADGYAVTLLDGIRGTGSVELEGTFDVTSLGGTLTPVDDEGLVDARGHWSSSGFVGVRTETLDVALSEGAAVTFGDFAAVSDGRSYGSSYDGKLSYCEVTGGDTYYLNGSDSASIEDIRSVTPAAAVEMTGGQLNLNDAAVDNAVHATGGTLSHGAGYAGELLVEGNVAVADELGGEITIREGALTTDAFSIAATDANDASLSGVVIGQDGLHGSIDGQLGILANVLIDLNEGATVHMSNVSLTAGSRITDEPATLVVDNVNVDLVLNENVFVGEVTTLAQGTQMVQGNYAVSLNREASVLQMLSTAFDSVYLTGDALQLSLCGIAPEELQAYDLISLSFNGGVSDALLDRNLDAVLNMGDMVERYALHSWYEAGEGAASKVYFSFHTIPEPATATLTMLALAALVSRRRRKAANCR